VPHKSLLWTYLSRDSVTCCIIKKNSDLCLVCMPFGLVQTLERKGVLQSIGGEFLVKRGKAVPR
jgi:hypothetical protein